MSELCFCLKKKKGKTKDFHLAEQHTLFPQGAENNFASPAQKSSLKQAGNLVSAYLGQRYLRTSIQISTFHEEFFHNTAKLQQHRYHRSTEQLRLERT